MMGLFRKDNPAEKKLKKLTGGFILSTDFIELLRKHNLEISDGVEIRNQLKEEIKSGSINENNLESRLDQLISQRSNIVIDKPENSKKCPKCGEMQDLDNAFCINCGHKFINKEDDKDKINCPHCNKKISKSSKVCPVCNKSLTDLKTCPMCNIKQYEYNRYCIGCGYDFNTKNTPEIKKEIKEEEIKEVFEFSDDIHKIQFLNNYEFNLKTCPDCNTKFLKADPFCFNCGASVLTQDTVKNDNLEVKDGKLVKQNENNQNDELSDLEALYNQTVQSKYAPGFKVAYVLYLDMFSKNPSKQFPEKLAKNYSTTPNKLKKQALEDDFIELAPAISEAKNCKVSQLKDILKEHDLKVSGKKDELIERLRDNLSEDELKKYFKSKNYQISSKGVEFLSLNTPILYIFTNKSVSRAFSSSEIGKIFEEKQYSQEEIYDIVLDYLKRILDDKLTQERWVDFKIYSNAIAQVQEDKNELKDALSTRIKVFLFDINNYSIVLNRPDPRKTKLKKKDMADIVNLMHKLTLPIDELKELFETAFNEVLFKTVITSQDSLIYLLKVFGGEDLDSVSKEINETYSNPY